MLLMKWSRANVPEPTDKFCESRMDKRWEIQHGSLDDDWWGCRWTLMHSARFICYSTTGSTASVPKGLSKGQSMGSNVAIIAVMFFCWHLDNICCYIYITSLRPWILYYKNVYIMHWTILNYLILSGKLCTVEPCYVLQQTVRGNWASWENIISGKTWNTLIKYKFV